VNINSVRLGAADLAVGDLVGSCLFNLLILALLDLTRYSHGRMFSEASARHVVAASVSIALTGIAAIFIFLGPRIEFATVASISPGSVVLLAAYILGVRLIFRARSGTTETPEEVPLRGCRGSES
jgi:cation:H+ antiporter